MKLLCSIDENKDVVSKEYVDGAINDLDSSQTATAGYALSSITQTDGELTSKSEIRIPVAYSGTSAPSNSLGENGDIYIKYNS